jgi:hypothetical protein
MYFISSAFKTTTSAYPFPRSFRHTCQNTRGLVWVPPASDKQASEYTRKTDARDHMHTSDYTGIHAGTCGYMEKIPIYVSVCIPVIPPVSACTRFVIMDSHVRCIPVFTCRLHYQAHFRVKRHGSSCIRMCALNLEMYSGVSACDRLESA